MSGPGNGQPAPFRVPASGKVRQEIAALKDLAANLGIQAEFAQALDRVYHRLETDPLSFGELVKESPHLQLIVHVGSEKPLTVRFAINRQHRFVVILKMLLRPASL
jgi:hypothetical protein